MNASAAPPPQLTTRALVLGLVLSVLLAGANAYLGRFAGMTVANAIWRRQIRYLGVGARRTWREGVR